MSRTNRFWNTSTSLSLTRALLLLSIIWVLCLLTACVHKETTAAISIIAYQPPKPGDQTAGRQNTVTVEQCVRDSDLASENAGKVTDLLIQQETIQRSLPETKLTHGMCEEIGTRTPDGSLVHKLVAAQNYIQEIALVEQAIGQVTGEASIETPPPQYSSAEIMMPPVGSASPSTISEEENLYRSRGHRTSALEISSAESRTPRERITGHLESISEVEIGSTIGALLSAQSDQYGPPSDSGGGPEETPEGQPQNLPGSSASVRMSNTANQAADQGVSPEETFEEVKEAGERDGLTPEKADAGARCATTIKFADNTWAELHRGAFEIMPQDLGEEMKIDDYRTVRLLLSPTTRDLFESLKRDLEKIDGVSETLRSCVAYSDRMKAALGGTNVEIEPHGDELQPIAANTIWQWTVTATEKGKSPLYLNLQQEIVPASGESSYRPVAPPLYETEVTIVATFSQRASNFFGNNWQWLWAAILVPVAGWAWTKYRKRNTENQAEE